MNCNNRKANIPFVLQPCYGTGTASWVAEQTDRCSKLFNHFAKKLIYWGSPAVVKHFRNSCDSFKMLLLLLIFYHPQVPVSEMDFLNQLGWVESPSTTVKDDWIHYAARSTLKGTCSLVTLRPLRGQSVPNSSVELLCIYSMQRDVIGIIREQNYQRFCCYNLASRDHTRSYAQKG